MANGSRTAAVQQVTAPGAGPSAVPLQAVESRRSVIDYSLARRAALTALATGGSTPLDVCDAHPYLLRAARFHGELTARTCPVCRRQHLTHVTYVYGDELGEYSGRVKTRAELAVMAREHAEFRVYVVEVCQSCRWNHLTTSYVLGDGVPRRGTRRRVERDRGDQREYPRAPGG